MPDIASPPPLPPLPQSFDDPLGRKIIELHVWSVGEGLRGKEAALLFDGLCQRLVIAGVPLWRLRGNAHIASAMGRLCLHLVARPYRHPALYVEHDPIQNSARRKPIRLDRDPWRAKISGAAASSSSEMTSAPGVPSAIAVKPRMSAYHSNERIPSTEPRSTAPACTRRPTSSPR